MTKVDIDKNQDQSLVHYC